MNYFLIFLTGLTSGGITCAAMQGGLLASVIANGKTKELEDKSPSTKPNTFDLADWGPVTAFLTTKWISHILLGLLLGLVGGALTLSLSAKLFFQGFAAIFMLATAGNLLDLHPIFRYLAFTPPAFVRKLIKGNAQKSSLFAPAVLGALTVFIPCGVTQAMAVLAINSSSPVEGALIMASFIAGTIPIFMVIGIATAKLTELWRTYFLRVAAAILVLMAISSLNGIATVLDSPLAWQRLGPSLVALLPPYDQKVTYAQDPSVTLVGGVQKVKLSITNNGYTPRYFRVQKDTPVELTLETTGGVYSCATAFTFRAFDIQELLGPVDKKVHTFTPTKPGRYTFSCSMGMYSGTMEVI
jgi:sulfite exporter TauE/SafE